MAFLEKKELKTVADIQMIDLITGLDDEIVTDIIEESIDKMKGYLSRFYDVEKIFGAEGKDRKKSILKKLKDIVIYEIYERHTRQVNEVAARRYAEAMDWLEKANTGEQGDSTLPKRPDKQDNDNEDNVNGTSGDSRFGGNHHYDSLY